LKLDSSKQQLTSLNIVEKSEPTIASQQRGPKVKEFHIEDD